MFRSSVQFQTEAPFRQRRKGERTSSRELDIYRRLYRTRVPKTELKESQHLKTGTETE